MGEPAAAAPSFLVGAATAPPAPGQKGAQGQQQQQQPGQRVQAAAVAVRPSTPPAPAAKKARIEWPVTVSVVIEHTVHPVRLQILHPPPSQ